MDEVKMEEIQSTTNKKRTATRTHTKGLGLEVSFYPMVGSEGYSLEVEITEVLTENFRRAIDLFIKENKEVYVGEVTGLTLEGTDSITSGYGKSISHVIIGLKTAKGTKQLKLDPTVHDTLVKEKVAVGDVIYIEANSGAVKRVGRIDALTAEFDLEAEEYVPLPKGEVHKEEIVQDVTLHDLDANVRPQGGLDILSLMGPMMKPRKTEMTDQLRQEINKVQNLDGEILVASTQNFLPSSFLIAREHTFYDRASFSLMCLYMGGGTDPVDLPTPAVIKPIELWTGKQLCSVLVCPNDTKTEDGRET